MNNTGNDFGAMGTAGVVSNSLAIQGTPIEPLNDKDNDAEAMDADHAMDDDHASSEQRGIVRGSLVGTYLS